MNEHSGRYRCVYAAPAETKGRARLVLALDGGAEDAPRIEITAPLSAMPFEESEIGGLVGGLLEVTLTPL